MRRSRTVQRQLARVFPALELPGFRTDFRWLQRATGEARDLDVYVLGFERLRAMVPEAVRADLAPLRQVLEHWRLTAHARWRGRCASRRTDELLDDWEMLLESLVELPTDDRPDATVPIGELAGQRIRKVYKRVVRMGDEDRRLEPGRGVPRAAQEGQGAALHAGAVRDAAVRPRGGGRR